MVRKPLDFGRKPFTIGKMKAILWAIQRWPTSVFLSNFLIFPHQTRHVRPTKHKICNVNACFSCDVWSQRCGPVPGPKVWPIFHQCQKLSYFPQNYNSWVVDLCFDDLDGLNTLKHCEKCSETWNLGLWFSSYGRKPFHGHAYHLGNI